MKGIFHYMILLVSLLILIGCEEDEESACFRCLYEQQRTGCNNSNYGDWEERSITIDDPIDGLDPVTFCNDQFPANDLHCEANCCVNFHNRNVRVADCP